MPGPENDIIDVQVNGTTYSVEVPKGTPVSKAYSLAVNYAKSQESAKKQQPQVKPVTLSGPPKSDLESIMGAGPQDIAAPTVEDFLARGQTTPTNAQVAHRTPVPAVEKNFPTFKPASPTGKKIAGTTLVRPPAPSSSSGTTSRDAALNYRQAALNKMVQERQKRSQIVGMPKGREWQNAIREREDILKRFANVPGTKYALTNPDGSVNYRSLMTILERTDYDPGLSEDYQRLRDMDTSIPAWERYVENLGSMLEAHGAPATVGATAAALTSAALPEITAPMPLPVKAMIYAAPIATAMGASGLTSLAQGATNPMSPEQQLRLAQAEEANPETAFAVRNLGAPILGKPTLIPSRSMLLNAGIGGAMNLAQQGYANLVAPEGQKPGFNRDSLLEDMAVQGIFSNPHDYMQRPAPVRPAPVRPAAETPTGLLALPAPPPAPPAPKQIEAYLPGTPLHAGENQAFPMPGAIAPPPPENPNRVVIPRTNPNIPSSAMEVPAPVQNTPAVAPPKPGEPPVPARRATIPVVQPEAVAGPSPYAMEPEAPKETAPAKKRSPGRPAKPKELTPEQSAERNRVVVEPKTLMETVISNAHNSKKTTVGSDSLTDEEKDFLTEALKKGQITYSDDGKRIQIGPGENAAGLANDYAIAQVPETKKAPGRPRTTPAKTEEPKPATPPAKPAAESKPLSTFEKVQRNLNEGLQAHGFLRFTPHLTEDSVVKQYLDSEYKAGRLEHERTSDADIYRVKKNEVSEPPTQTMMEFRAESKRRGTPQEITDGLPYPADGNPTRYRAEEDLIRPRLEPGHPERQKTLDALSALSKVVTRKNIRLDEDGYTLYNKEGKVKSYPDLYSAAEGFAESPKTATESPTKTSEPRKFTPTGKVIDALTGNHSRIEKVKGNLRAELRGARGKERANDVGVALRVIDAIKRTGYNVEFNGRGYTLTDPQGKVIARPQRDIYDAAIDFSDKVPGLTESSITGKQAMRIAPKGGFDGADLNRGDHVLVKTPRGVRLDKVTSVFEVPIGNGKYNRRIYLAGDSDQVIYSSRPPKSATVLHPKYSTAPEFRRISDIVAKLAPEEVADTDLIESRATDTSPPFGGSDRDALIREELAKAAESNSKDYDAIENAAYGFDKTFKLPGNAHDFLDGLDRAIKNWEGEINRLNREIRKRKGQPSPHLEDALEGAIRRYNSFSQSKELFNKIYPEAEKILRERRLGYRGDVSISYDPEMVVTNRRTKVGGISLRIEGDIKPEGLRAFEAGVTPGVRYRSSSSARPRQLSAMGEPAALRAEWDRIHDFFELPRRAYPRQIQPPNALRLPAQEGVAKGSRVYTAQEKNQQGLLSQVDLLENARAISKKEADIGRAFIKELPPEYFEGLTTEVREKNNESPGTVGHYENSNRLIRFMADTLASIKDSGIVGIPHEVSHHLERFIFDGDARLLQMQFEREYAAWQAVGAPKAYEHIFGSADGSTPPDFSEWFAEAVRTNWLRQRGIPDPLSLTFSNVAVRESRFPPVIARILHQSHMLAYAFAKRLANLGQKDAAKMVWDKFVGAKYDPSGDYGQLQWKQTDVHKGVLSMKVNPPEEEGTVTFGGEKKPFPARWNFMHYLRSPLSVYGPSLDPNATGADAYGDPITLGSFETLSPERGGKISREARNSQMSIDKRLAEWRHKIEAIDENLRVARGDKKGFLQDLRDRGQEIDVKRGLMPETKKQAQYNEFVDLIEKDLTDPTRKSSDPNIQKALDLHDELSKEWLQYIRESQEAVGRTLPPDWGITDKGYYRHQFIGDAVLRYWDSSAKEWKFKSAHRTYTEALAAAAKLHETDPTMNFDITGHLTDFGDSPVRVSTPKFWQTVHDLTRSASEAASNAAGMPGQIVLDKSDILSDLHGVAPNSSKRKHLSLLLKRTGVEGYSKAYSDVMHSTAYQLARAQELSKLNKKIAPLIDAERTHGDPELAREMQAWLDNLWGVPTALEKSLGQAILNTPLINHVVTQATGQYEPALLIRHLVKKATGLQSKWKLAASPQSALANLVQPTMTLLPYASNKDVLSAYKLSLTPSFRQKMLESGVLQSSSQLEGSGPTLKEHGGNLFERASRQNRAVGYAYGWQQAKKMKMTDAQADLLGRSWAELVEFDNSAFNASPAVRGTLNRLFFQFKGFEQKNIERAIKSGGAFNLTDQRSIGTKLKQGGKLATALFATGGINAFGPVAAATGTLAFYYAFHMAKQHGASDEEAKQVATAVQMGLPAAFAGVDISRSVTIMQEPYGNDFNERAVNYFFGPTVSSVRSGIEIGRRVTSGQPPTVATLGGITPYARMVDAMWQAQKAAQNKTWDEFFAPSATISKVKIGNEQYVRLNAGDTLKRAVGLTPAKVSQAYAIRDAKQRLALEKKSSSAWKRNFANVSSMLEKAGGPGGNK